MKIRNKYSLQTIVTFLLVGCSFGHEDEPCMDNPKMSWCSRNGVEIYCEMPFMMENCRKTCKICSTENSTDCKSLNCDHICSSSKSDAPRCKCRVGYKLLEDGKTCRDIDECETESPCPGENCINTEGSYRCEGKCGSNQLEYYKDTKCCEVSKGNSCGINSENGGPEGRGKKAIITRWPWMTLILIESSPKDCAGVLVDSSWVLAAAHCVRGARADDVTLLFGIATDEPNHSLNENFQERHAETIHIHPNYQREGFRHNVALIKLNKDVELTNFVRPNCLPHGEQPSIHRRCWALGYAKSPATASTYFLSDATNIIYTRRSRYVEIIVKLHPLCVRPNPQDNHPNFTLLYNLVVGALISRRYTLQSYRRLSSPVFPMQYQTVINAEIITVSKFRDSRRTLHEETVYISTPKDCGDKDNGICVSHKAPESVGDCQGSTGGPLVCQRCSSCEWYVAGLRATEGQSCAFRNESKSNFTKSSDYEVWMREKMGLAGLRSQIEQPCQPQRRFAVWNSWGSWSTCSVSCGNGTAQRTRTCRGAERGPNGCLGDSTSTRRCQRRSCKTEEPKNSEWGEWSQCSSTCGQGTRRRFRSCKFRNSGKPCRGRDKDEEKCNTQPCPTWSRWSQWGQCSVTCGRGKRVSTRACVNGELGQDGCRGRIQRAKNCRKRNCPDWSNWSSWSSCSVSCGAGVRSSERRCLFRNTKASGCPGNSTRTKICNEDDCEDCSEWSPWSGCSATCGDGTQRRSRKCSRFSLKEKTKERTCHSGVCPPVWSEWSNWSECSVTCGRGERSRRRQCDVGDDSKCKGSSLESKPCDRDRCRTQGWSDWSPWGRCDATCENGLQTRERRCSERRCHGTDRERRLCKGNNCLVTDKCSSYNDDWPSIYCRSNVRNCLRQEFANYCAATCCREIRKQVYSEWSSWGRCSTSCGGGWHERQRNCLVRRWCQFFGELLREVRECGGRSCFARESEPLCSSSCGGGLRQRACMENECSADQPFVTEECNTEPCPNAMSEWSEWSECAVSCGNGTKSRTRNCTGELCRDEVTRESAECNVGDCGLWSEWKYAGQCSVTCGLGSITKTRICVSGTCEGDSKQEELCVGSDCPTVESYAVCEDDPTMRDYCKLLKVNCNNGYMAFACPKTCGTCS